MDAFVGRGSVAEGAEGIPLGSLQGVAGAAGLRVLRAEECLPPSRYQSY